MTGKVLNTRRHFLWRNSCLTVQVPLSRQSSKSPEISFWFFSPLHRCSDVLLGSSQPLRAPLILSLKPVECLHCSIGSSSHISSSLSWWTETESSSQECPNMSTFIFPSLIWILLVPWRETAACHDAANVKLHCSYGISFGSNGILRGDGACDGEPNCLFLCQYYPSFLQIFIESSSPLLSNIFIPCSELLWGACILLVDGGVKFFHVWIMTPVTQ